MINKKLDQHPLGKINKKEDKLKLIRIINKLRKYIKKSIEIINKKINKILIGIINKK